MTAGQCARCRPALTAWRRSIASVCALLPHSLLGRPLLSGVVCAVVPRSAKTMTRATLGLAPSRAGAAGWAGAGRGDLLAMQAQCDISSNQCSQCWWWVDGPTSGKWQHDNAGAAQRHQGQPAAPQPETMGGAAAARFCSLQTSRQGSVSTTLQARADLRRQQRRRRRQCRHERREQQLIRRTGWCAGLVSPACLRCCCASTHSPSAAISVGGERLPARPPPFPAPALLRWSTKR
jgi:hypothetical protein